MGQSRFRNLWQFGRRNHEAVVLGMASNRMGACALETVWQAVRTTIIPFRLENKQDIVSVCLCRIWSSPRWQCVRTSNEATMHPLRVNRAEEGAGWAYANLQNEPSCPCGAPHPMKMESARGMLGGVRPWVEGRSWLWCAQPANATNEAIATTGGAVSSPGDSAKTEDSLYSTIFSRGCRGVSRIRNGRAKW
jgi:hypothetical protein